MKLIDKGTMPFPNLNIVASVNRSRDKLHVSDIYTNISNRLHHKSSKNPTSEMMSNELFKQVGFLFEIALSNAFGENLGIRPGEIERDGIVGSPDGINFMSGRLEEYKVTWKSSNNSPEDNWRWMTQIKAYLKLTGLSECLLRVLYVMGNYKGSGPQYREYLLSFTEEEIEENWEMLVTHAKTMRKEG